MTVESSNPSPQPDAVQALIDRLAAQETNGTSTIQPLAVEIARDAVAAGLAIGRQVIASDKISIANVIELARLVYQADFNLRQPDSDEDVPDGQQPPLTPTEIAERLDAIRTQNNPPPRGGNP